MNIVSIIVATLAACGSLIYAALWQTPTTDALALLLCGGVFSAAIAWYLRPVPSRKRHNSHFRQH